ncbi:MAG: complex I subunit 4 family protein [Phycisphaerae bacterium]
MPTSSSILTILLFLPFIGGLAILLIPPRYARKSRPTAIIVTALTLALAILAASHFNWNRFSYAPEDPSVQLAMHAPLWPSLGIQYFVGVDGISLPLLLLITAIGLLAAWASYGINQSVKLYYTLLLFLITSLIGAAISLDLVLFCFFLEIAALPFFLLVTIWGGAKKEYAAVKFLCYSLLGAIALLIAVVGIHSHAHASNGNTFNLVRLATDPLLKARFARGGDAYHFGLFAFWMLLAGFATRLPLVPLHPWLPDLHTESPTPLSLVLTGAMLPLAAYGILRICYPLFPQQAADTWFCVAAVAVISIAFSALVAIAQKDLKRFLACISISQMAYILLGLSVMTPTATQGAIFQMIAAGISSAMLFFAAGILYDRARHREIRRFGGIWSHMPAYAGWTALAFFAAMGIPGLCGFVGQFLVLLGAFAAADPASFLMRHTGGAAYLPLLWLTLIAATAAIFTSGALLWTFQRLFMGAPKPEHQNFPGLSASEKWILATLGLSAVILGIAPALLLNFNRPAIDGFIKLVTR